jgi:hypothetical protein
MKTAIWFSRHTPTAAQIEDAARLGYTLTVTETGTRLGTMDIADNGDVKVIVSALLGHVAEQNAAAIFGVFAAPILGQLARTADDIRQSGECREGKDIPCFAAWNVMRAVEGAKPTFEHRKWVGIGRLSQESLRWVG